MKFSPVIQLLISAALLCTNTEGHACTLFSANSNGTVMIGRNLDWKFNDGIVWVQPPEKNKHGIIIFEQYGGELPYEGMNGEGLFIGENAVPGSNTTFIFGRPFVRSLKIIKIVLERCATVDEALEIFPKYNIVFGTSLGYPQVHYMIADKTGNSAIVEYFNNEMRIIRKPGNARYQLMTNFYMVMPDEAMQKANSARGGYDRFATAKTALDKMTSATVNSCKTILEACYNRIYPTIWSNVYDLKKLEIHTCFKRDFKKCKIFNLPEEMKNGSARYKLSDLFR